MRSGKMVLSGLIGLNILAASHAEDILIPAKLAETQTVPSDAHARATLINRVLGNLPEFTKFDATHLTRDDYLKFTLGQVRAMRKYQDAQGRIIDPVLQKEIQYATPCYAHAVAVLIASGYESDPDLLQSGILAMDRAVHVMLTNTAPDGHGDFFTWPVMLALGEYKSLVPSDRWERWNADLGRIYPSKLYNFYNNRVSLNWVLVHTAGEFLRFKAGMANLDYVESMLEKQAHHFTDHGMYSEHGEPMAYDLFSRLYMTGILTHGYEGSHRDRLRDLMWRGAWMTMLMQSPSGEAPTGYRSSQHIWLEAEQAAILEAFASASNKAGRTTEALAFKRAARLSLQTMLNWVRADGSGYVVKNRFPIEAKHGYESYSSHTQYNLLACSMAVQAYRYADESISEAASPADVGGFVLPVLDPFHKVFASASGGYLEYETRGDTGDRKWTPIGIVRIHLKGANPQLGPSDGVSVYGNDGIVAPDYAVGPEWRDSAGKWTRLASLRSSERPKVEIELETPQKVVFSISYAIDSVKIRQHITLEPKSVEIEDTVTSNGITGIRAGFPMLIDDGAEKTTITFADKSVTLKKTALGSVKFEVLTPDSTDLIRRDLRLKSRNGIVEPIHAERAGNTIRYRISTP